MVAEALLGVGQVAVCFTNNVIHWTKVWDEVILLEALVSGWGPGKKWLSLLLFNGLGLDEPVILWEIPGSVGIGSRFHVFEGVGDISVHSEVWYEIVFLNIILRFGPVPMVTKLIFSISEGLIVMGENNIFSSPVWDEVVDIMVGFFMRMLVLTATC